ncbi:peptidoglycan-associated lipoprotein Pal [Spartinivicinus poritis]|uniref:Peptidoglycan-associated lipoprotein n=1 Tax=Spartinivicinus poritis TaxID=2994640 RepID=A0ABT5U7K8_9GAMM|nr:peptidoglycan-associated lipoprotein Pal [Spartinivicinus sp. A2-2]MDE1462348.1 peptidoglycan-associated lipoprotein Pal [Spartinivicinus sp. A2-2]
MQLVKLGKVVLLASSVVWLAACSSTGGKGTGTTDTVEDDSTASITTDSIDGGVDSSSAALLDKKIFLFEFDDSKISPDDYAALDAHASALVANSNKSITIQGHTDERGTREYNLALGERRANAIKKYLVIKGVAPSQIEATSYGEEQPVAFGHDEASWSQNRRAIIITN